MVQLIIAPNKAGLSRLESSLGAGTDIGKVGDRRRGAGVDRPKNQWEDTCLEGTMGTCEIV